MATKVSFPGHPRLSLNDVHKNPALRVLHRLEARAGIYTGSRDVQEIRTILSFHGCVFFFLLAGLRSRNDIKMYVYTTTIYDDTESARVIADEPCYHEKEEGYKSGAESCAQTSSSTEAHAKEIPANNSHDFDVAVDSALSLHNYYV